MATNPRKRQQQLARKASKRKARHQRMASTYADFASFNPRSCMMHESLITGNFLEQGMGQVLISRKRSNGTFPTGVFLVDIYCLGVKDAFLKTLDILEYNRLKERTANRCSLNVIHQNCARKLVEGAVDYARSIGFAPHKDYHKAKRIFGDIDSSNCPRTFTYGRDGKPFFIAGPHDTPARCREIINNLEQSLGKDGFDFATITGGSDAFFD